MNHIRSAEQQYDAMINAIADTISNLFFVIADHWVAIAIVVSIWLVFNSGTKSHQ